MTPHRTPQNLDIYALSVDAYYLERKTGEMTCEEQKMTLEAREDNSDNHHSLSLSSNTWAA